MRRCTGTWDRGGDDEIGVEGMADSFGRACELDLLVAGIAADIERRGNWHG